MATSLGTIVIVVTKVHCIIMSPTPTNGVGHMILVRIRWRRRRRQRRRHTFLPAQYFVTQWLDFTKFSWLCNWDITKNWLDFGDLDLIFKVTAVEKLKILWHFLVCTISSEPVVGFLPDFHDYIIGTYKGIDYILVPWPNFQRHGSRKNWKIMVWWHLFSLKTLLLVLTWILHYCSGLKKSEVATWENVPSDVRTTKTQISLRFRAVWSASSLSACKDLLLNVFERSSLNNIHHLKAAHYLISKSSVLLFIEPLHNSHLSTTDSFDSFQ